MTQPIRRASTPCVLAAAAISVRQRVTAGGRLASGSPTTGATGAAASGVAVMASASATHVSTPATSWATVPSGHGSGPSVTGPGAARTTRTASAAASRTAPAARLAAWAAGATRQALSQASTAALKSDFSAVVSSARASRTDGAGGFSGPADTIAAGNIARRAAVNRPDAGRLSVVILQASG